MHQLTITFSGSDLEQLKNIKQQLSKKHPEIRVQKANLETIPGAIDTLSVLGVTLSVVSDNTPDVVGSWLQGLLKSASSEAKIALHVNGVRAGSQQEIESIIKKHIKTGKQEPKKTQ